MKVKIVCQECDCQDMNAVYEGGRSDPVLFLCAKCGAAIMKTEEFYLKEEENGKRD